MEEAAQQAPAQDKKLTQEERSKIMSEAAKRRWAKARQAKAKAKAAPKTAPKTPLGKKKPAAPREFSTALKTAEKRLAQAILERSKAAATYAVLSAEIPSLQRLIVALQNPLGVMIEQGMPVAPTLEQIVGDQPLLYVNPLRPAPAIPVVPIPQPLHPANMQGRAGGGAIGVELGEQGDDDQFLKESAVAGGEWR